jgi:hypothetical protein
MAQPISTTLRPSTWPTVASYTHAEAPAAFDTVDRAVAFDAVLALAAGTVTVRCSGDSADLSFTMVVGQILPIRGLRLVTGGTILIGNLRLLWA